MLLPVLGAAAHAADVSTVLDSATTSLAFLQAKCYSTHADAHVCCRIGYGFHPAMARESKTKQDRRIADARFVLPTFVAPLAKPTLA